MTKEMYEDLLERNRLQISELKYQLTHRNCLDCSNHSSKLRMRNLELEKENAELKCECRRCVYSDCPCILSDYGKDKNGICEHFKDVFDENAELKESGSVICDRLSERIDEIVELKNENIGLKNQLTKAKEIIRDFISVAIDYIDKEDKNYSYIVEAEQFLREIER